MVQRTSGARDLYASVTNELIRLIERGIEGEYSPPWRQSGLSLPTNAATGRRYRGANILPLWMAAQRLGFAPSPWASYRQWAGVGAQVRRGERATMVTFYQSVDEETSELKLNERRNYIARTSAVFNAAQVESFAIPASAPPVCSSPVDRLSQVERFVAATRANILYGGDRAYYDRVHDSIHMPVLQDFIGSDTQGASQAFYSVLLHELTHWSGGPLRLNRQFGDRVGDDRYAFEELVAELASACLSAELGITYAARTDHARYLQSW